MAKKPTIPPMPPPEAKAIQVQIDRIDVPADRQREFQPAVAEAIASTLPTLGLQQPIGVGAVNDRFRLVYGMHRLEAAKVVGWQTIPAVLLHLDENDLDASAAVHEAVENLLRANLSALDRMSQLSAMKVAHDKLYPGTARGGRPRVMTREAENNLDILPKFSFSKSVAAQVGLDRRTVNRLTGTWDGLSPESRRRLRGSRLADKQSELFALANLSHVAQKIVLDQVLANPPGASTVAEAVALIQNNRIPSAEQRRTKRYYDTIKSMEKDDRREFFNGIEEEIYAYALEKGWVR